MAKETRKFFASIRSKKNARTIQIEKIGDKQLAFCAECSAVTCLRHTSPLVRLSAAGRKYPFGNLGPILEDAGALSWPDLECLGIRPILRGGGHHGPKLSGPADFRPGYTAATPVVREHFQAPDKSTKALYADSGLLHSLLNLRTFHDLEGHPKVGASWEGFVLQQVVRQLRAGRDECFFWATHGGAELDLLVVRGNRRFGFEVKRTTSPKITPSMRHALKDLKLDRLDIIHAGDETFMLDKKIRAVAFVRLLDTLKMLA